MAVFIRGAHGEFVAIELTQRHHAGVGEIAHHRRVERTHIAFEHARRSGGRKIARHEDVLVRDRHTGQRRDRAAGDARVGIPGLRHRDFGPHVEKRVQVLVALDAIEVQLCEFDR